MRNSKHLKQNKGLSTTDIVFIMTIGSIISTFLGYVVYRINHSEKALIHFSIIPLICGLVFEHKRIAKDWKPIIWTLISSFVFSFIAFLKSRGEKDYILENHIEMWPFAFLFLYILGVISFHKEETTKKLTEGITLMQSMAIIYWASDLGLWTSLSISINICLGLALLFCLYSTFNAFTNFILSRTNRLVLSIGSSIIMVTFAVESILKIYYNEEGLNFIPPVLYINLRYFLLGISSIYMANNILMLLRFLPSKGAFFNSKYYQDLQELKTEHIERYSSKQVRILDSYLCLLFVGGLFWLNYKHSLLPRNFVIWSVFILFPLFLSMIHRFTRR